jgi:short-subunit dehydrogenase
MQKVVVVTGASTGIGFDTVRNLIAHDFTVVATVRKNSDEENLKKNFGEKVKVLQLDVGQSSEVLKLPELLKEKFGITELFGLVNNAGVALAGPFMYQNFSEVQNIIQINVISLMQVTQVLLFLLGAFSGSKNPGRIVNISSVAGKSSLPFLSVYAASKHAVEGFSEGLRREMLLFGVKVIIVGPGSIKTPIWQKGFEVIKDKYSHTAFAESFARFIQMSLREVDHALEPSAVSDMIVEALTVSDPKVRYAPVPRKFRNMYLPMLLPRKRLDKLVGKVLKLIQK